MAHFYGEVWGKSNGVSRTGTKTSGISTSARGWNSGVDVRGFVDENGNDAFEITVTGGSNSPSGEVLKVIQKEIEEALLRPDQQVHLQFGNIQLSLRGDI